MISGTKGKVELPGTEQMSPGQVWFACNHPDCFAERFENRIVRCGTANCGYLAFLKANSNTKQGG